MSKNTIKQGGGRVRRMLEDTAARLGALEGAAHAERLRVEQQLRTGVRARGTGDMTAASRAAMATTDRGLAVRLEVALRGPDAPMSLVELARHVAAPAGRVQAVLKRLRTTPCPTASGHVPDVMTVYNHGTGSDPRWAWVIGDAVEAPTLYQAIERMLRRRSADTADTRRGYTFSELMLATGARRGRVSGALVEFARGGAPIYTIGGSDRKYVWFMGSLSLLPAALRKHARPVKLAPDKNKV